MPGVPSGRGCNACRQQKKKCDSPTHPCPRCKRLNIPCVGLGQRRYKFVQDEKRLSPGDNFILQRVSGSESSSHSTPGSDAATLFQSPSNETTRLVAAFTEKIKPARGIKYNLAWTYGDYLNHVPSRLGRNEALDNATDVWMTAFEHQFSTSGVENTPVLLEKYGRSLASLRKCLDDPVKAKAPETLCAILFLWNCQQFIRMIGSPASAHSEGAAQIIRLRGCAEKSQDLFESNLLLSLRAVVLFSSMLEGRVEFSDEEWVAMFDNKAYELAPQGQAVQCLTRLPNLMRRIKAALLGGHQAQLPELRALAHSLRDELDPSLFKLREQWHENMTETVDTKRPFLPGLLRCHHLRSYGFGLAIGIFINEVRLALCPDAVDILEESQAFAVEILELAKIGLEYRPLGGYVFGVCLLAAYCGAYDLDTKFAIQMLHLEYARDFHGADGPQSCQDLKLICGREWSRFVV
ncbi:hypothetical protein H2200_009299 [Cladophialophora chaetospira]|uniref:Zn(2)-C6 fungal-type domain-containing protein n=1 Tax=Cladophialophora chaetospira TaxID=386627 RepID=A0AA39CF88_9EURO|nr:hypothetical protein H2200_009299 [Cladophialophora chaetospira]